MTLASRQPPIVLVVFGDIHGHWDEADDAFYPTYPADVFLWTGDLTGLKHLDALLRRLSAISPHVYGVLGNHDGAHTPHVIAEALGRDVLCRVFAGAHTERVRALTTQLGRHHLGFARQDLPQWEVSLIGMRPHSTGGARLHFPRALSQVYGVDDPTAAHRVNIDAAQHDDLILIGHNGPLGLGDRPTSPFGIDFRSGGGDLGDPDYRAAIDHAQATGRRVCLAIGGHMHDRLHRRSRHLGSRELIGQVEGVPVLNACRVPRIDKRRSGQRHHHTECHLDRRGGQLSIERVTWIPGEGVIDRQLLHRGPLPPGVPNPSTGGSQ